MDDPKKKRKSIFDLSKGKKKAKKQQAASPKKRAISPSPKKTHLDELMNQLEKMLGLSEQLQDRVDKTCGDLGLTFKEIEMMIANPNAFTPANLKAAEKIIGKYEKFVKKATGRGFKKQKKMEEKKKRKRRFKGKGLSSRKGWMEM